jgi:hypothetical protein
MSQRGPTPAERRDPQFENLCRHYRMGETVIRAVDGVSLEVCAGRRIRCPARQFRLRQIVCPESDRWLDRPTSGEASWFRINLAQAFARGTGQVSLCTRVGMVFQSFNLIASMTLSENVELPLRFAESRSRPTRQIWRGKRSSEWD